MNEAQQVQENALSPGSDKFYSARITERYDISDELWVIRVDPGGDFRYDPGQYATLGVATPEKHFERAYSIVSAPHEKLLEFFVELVPHGDVTPRLYQDRVGDEFTLRNVAKGRFTLDTNSSRTNHLLVATVTGVAPFVSFARFLQQQWHAGKFKGEHKLFLIDGASRSWELGYWKELARLAAEFSWFTYIPTVSRPWDDKSWKGETGRVDELVRKYADSWGLTPENSHAYLCGHPSMIENTKGILNRHGWPKDAVKAEAFFIPGHELATAGIMSPG